MLGNLGFIRNSKRSKMTIQIVKINIKRLHPDAKIPIYATEHSAGFDIYSVEDYTLQPGETHAVASGISMEIPQGKLVEIWDRSGMGFKGIHRFAGVIDSDYRGEFKIILCNHTSQAFTINKGDRIAQAIVKDYYKADFKETDNLIESEREAGWNSSTGV